MNKELLESIDDIEFNYRNKLNFDRKYKFGVEIEFEKASYYKVEESIFKNRYLKKWDMHFEPTIQSMGNTLSLGGEVVSPVLHNTKKSWMDIKRTCELLKSLGANADEYSGAHIHIDQSILCNNNEYILKLLKLWTVYEHIIYEFSNGEREKGRMYLCCYAYSMATMLQKFIRCFHNYDSANVYKDVMLFCDTYKPSLKSGLWFADCKGVDGSRNNTIEIRCPNGTLNEVIWQNNVNFFINLLKSCTEDIDEEFIDYKLERYEDIYNYNSSKYTDDACELANIIFDEEIDKLYFLKQYTKKFK